MILFNFYKIQMILMNLYKIIIKHSMLDYNRKKGILKYFHIIKWFEKWTNKSPQ